MPRTTPASPQPAKPGRPASDDVADPPTAPPAGQVEAIRTGHCQCGNVAYQVVGDPIDPHLCACPHDTRISGGPGRTVGRISRQLPEMDGAWRAADLVLDLASPNYWCSSRALHGRHAWLRTRERVLAQILRAVAEGDGAARSRGPNPSGST
ncbi:GFA family protein [Streptomyces lydicus]